jgi:hypothetical protein
MPTARSTEQRSASSLAAVDTSDVIATIAIVVSGISAALAIVSLVLAFLESSRRDEEIRLLREESGRRDEELTLLRQQVAAEQMAWVRQQQGRIVVIERVPTSGSAQGIEYDVTVRNEGEYLATAILVELVDPNGGSVGSARLDRGLFQGEEETVKVATPPRDRYSGPYAIYVEWTDGRGQNRIASGITVGAP